MTTSALRSSLVLAVALFVSVSCAEGGATAATSAAATPSAQATVHNLKCGCAIDSIGACGNYIEVDGKYVALTSPIKMGPMEFCHKDGLKAKVDGKVENGTFVATSFAYVE